MQTTIGSTIFTEHRVLNVIEYSCPHCHVTDNYRHHDTLINPSDPIPIFSLDTVIQCPSCYKEVNIIVNK